MEQIGMCMCVYLGNDNVSRVHLMHMKFCRYVVDFNTIYEFEIEIENRSRGGGTTTSPY